ncbi:MAG: hypothetical protein ACE5HE_12280 [Phycisphaerae bacterium]
MDSIVEEKVKRFLIDRLRRAPHECGSVCLNINRLARKGGYGLDERFARSGLAAGPEARIAAAIVASALGIGGGTATSEHVIRNQVGRWVTTTAGTAR